MSVARANGHGGVYDYFFCLGRIRGGCASRYVAVDKVEEWICRHYESVQLKSDAIDGVRTQLLEGLEQDRIRTAQEVKRQRVRLSKLMNERKKLLSTTPMP
jgi:hypothetical protein